MKRKIRAYRKLGSEDATVNRIQEYVQAVLAPVASTPLLDGVLLKDVTLTAGQDNLVEHKLDREPLGWFVVRKRAQADVWDLQDQNRLKTSTLVLRSSANIVVDLWIF